jgi:type VI secretion system secreted protein Hcp
MFHYFAKIKGMSQGRVIGSAEGRVHGMGYGGKKISPATLSHTLFQIKTDLGSSNGALVGKRQHKPLTITKEVGVSSPQLLNAHWTNEVLNSMDIEIVGRPDTGKGEVVVSRITLTNATISNIHRYTPSLSGHASSPHSTNQLEEIDLVFQKITYSNVLGSTSASDDWTSNNK